MKATFDRSFQDDHGFAYDAYIVQDGNIYHEVIVSAAGGVDVRSPVQITGCQLTEVIAAVLDLEEARGFK